jgi:GPH family glycoside/pentoside/hexuronide:cation symporter
LLFFPLVSASSALMVWLVVSLAGTYVAYSAVSILHQSWGARLGGDEVQRSQVVAWREGLGLAGVILASISPLALGLPCISSSLFCSASFGLGWHGAARWCLRPPIRPIQAQRGRQLAQSAAWPVHGLPV